MIPHTQAASNWLKAQPPGIASCHVATVNMHRRRMFSLAVRVARENGVSLEDMRSKNRQRYISWPRQEFMLAAHRAGYSLNQIGRFLSRDHTTVLHGIRAAEAREARL